ncbi:MAG: hypothetical protein ACXWIU_02290 [Limisphaerales bacterium]
MSEPNNDYASVQITAAGSALDLAGTFVTCTDSTIPFQMSLNGGSWFRMERGIKIRVPGGFSKLFFRPIPGTAAGQTVSFYYGSIEVVDSRFNVVSDAPLISVYDRPSPDFILLPYGSGLAAAAAIDFPGIANTADGVAHRSRSVCIQIIDGNNNWADTTTAARPALKCLDLIWVLNDGTETIFDRVTPYQPREIFIGNSAPQLGPETPSAPLTLRLKNPNAAAINCFYHQTLWNT